MFSTQPASISNWSPPFNSSGLPHGLRHGPAGALARPEAFARRIVRTARLIPISLQVWHGAEDSPIFSRWLAKGWSVSYAVTSLILVTASRASPRASNRGCWLEEIGSVELIGRQVDQTMLFVHGRS